MKVDDCTDGKAINRAIAKILDGHSFDGTGKIENRDSTVSEFCKVCDKPKGYHSHGRYSFDIAAAWELILYSIENGYCPGLIFDDNGHWALLFDGIQHNPMSELPEGICTSFYGKASDWAETAPLAICRAFLKANGVTEIDCGKKEKY